MSELAPQLAPQSADYLRRVAETSDVNLSDLLNGRGLMVPSVVSGLLAEELSAPGHLSTILGRDFHPITIEEYGLQGLALGSQKDPLILAQEVRAALGEEAMFRAAEALKPVITALVNSSFWSGVRTMKQVLQLRTVEDMSYARAGMNLIETSLGVSPRSEHVIANALRYAAESDQRVPFYYRLQAFMLASQGIAQRVSFNEGIPRQIYQRYAQILQEEPNLINWYIFNGAALATAKHVLGPDHPEYHRQLRVFADPQELGLLPELPEHTVRVLTMRDLLRGGLKRPRFTIHKIRAGGEVDWDESVPIVEGEFDTLVMLHQGMKPSFAKERQAIDEEGGRLLDYRSQLGDDALVFVTEPLDGKLGIEVHSSRRITQYDAQTGMPLDTSDFAEEHVYIIGPNLPFLKLEDEQGRGIIDNILADKHEYVLDAVSVKAVMWALEDYYEAVDRFQWDKKAEESVMLQSETVMQGLIERRLLGFVGRDRFDLRMQKQYGVENSFKDMLTLVVGEYLEKNGRKLAQSGQFGQYFDGVGWNVASVVEVIARYVAQTALPLAFENRNTGELRQPADVHQAAVDLGFSDADFAEFEPLCRESLVELQSPITEGGKQVYVGDPMRFKFSRKDVRLRLWSSKFRQPA